MARPKSPQRRWAALVLLAVATLATAQDATQDMVTDYAPTTGVTCPDAPLLRVFNPLNQSLHPSEKEYITSRESTVLPNAWRDWIGDGSAIGYNASMFAGNWSRVGIAASGGGYRAAQYGAGVLSAFDARDESAKNAGSGGLLQVTSYISGLSGGSWLLGSMIMNDWPTVQEMVFGNGKDHEGWLLDLNLATPGGINIFSDENQWFYGSLIWSVIAKAQKGLDTSLTDPWSRMISYHFLNQTNRRNFFSNDSAHGAGQLWSDIPNVPAYQERRTPFPLVVVNSRPAGSNMTTLLPPEPVVYEITPLEFGSYDPSLSAMINLTYAGTRLTNGQPPNKTACVTGFDQAGFIMGTSASLFNQILDGANSRIEGFTNGDDKGLLHVLGRQLRSVRTRADDVANWPSPFQGLNPGVFEDSAASWLELIDGSSNAENVALGPLFVRARGLDVIVALDATANSPERWPNGTSPIFTASRLEKFLIASHQSFPPIPPSSNAWVEMGVNARPTFFGCDPKLSPPEYPLVVYLPNAPPVNGDDPVTNTLTFAIKYTTKHTTQFLNQTHLNTVSGYVPGSLGGDSNWGKCLQCAAVDRNRYKLKPVLARSDFCTRCFSRYCYDPLNPPTKNDILGRKLDFKDPDPQGVSKATGFLSRYKGVVIGAFVAMFAFVGVLIGFLIWLKRRKRSRVQYQPVPDSRGQTAPLSKFSQRFSSYELPEHRGGHSARGSEASQWSEASTLRGSVASAEPLLKS